MHRRAGAWIGSAKPSNDKSSGGGLPHELVIVGLFRPAPIASRFEDDGADRPLKGRQRPSDYAVGAYGSFERRKVVERVHGVGVGVHDVSCLGLVDHECSRQQRVGERKDSVRRFDSVPRGRSFEHQDQPCAVDNKQSVLLIDENAKDLREELFVITRLGSTASATSPDVSNTRTLAAPLFATYSLPVESSARSVGAFSWSLEMT